MSEEKKEKEIIKLAFNRDFERKALDRTFDRDKLQGEIESEERNDDSDNN